MTHNAAKIGRYAAALDSYLGNRSARNVQGSISGSNVGKGRAGGTNRNDRRRRTIDDGVYFDAGKFIALNTKVIGHEILRRKGRPEDRPRFITACPRPRTPTPGVPTASRTAHLDGSQTGPSRCCTG